MTTIRVDRASGTVLNWLVAKCMYQVHEDETLNGIVMHGRWISGMFEDPNYWIRAEEFQPSTKPDHGWCIVEKEIDCIRKRSKAEELDLLRPDPNFKFKADIFADIDGYFCAFGPTSLVAAMRCYIKSKLGEMVQVPEELLS